MPATDEFDYKAVFDHTPSLIFVVDPSFKIVAQNRAHAARQAASVEVLRAITAPPDDPQPVFELIVRRACEL